MPASGQLDAWDEFGFLDECDMTLREFCEVHDLPYPSHEKPLVGRVTFVGDNAQEFTDTEALLKNCRTSRPQASIVRC